MKYCYYFYMNNKDLKSGPNITQYLLCPTINELRSQLVSVIGITNYHRSILYLFLLSVFGSPICQKESISITFPLQLIHFCSNNFQQIRSRCVLVFSHLFSITVYLKPVLHQACMLVGCSCKMCKVNCVLTLLPHTRCKF